jgi:hypothetical protein
MNKSNAEESVTKAGRKIIFFKSTAISVGVE